MPVKKTHVTSALGILSLVGKVASRETNPMLGSYRVNSLILQMENQGPESEKDECSGFQDWGFITFL